MIENVHNRRISSVAKFAFVLLQEEIAVELVSVDRRCHGLALGRFKTAGFNRKAHVKHRSRDHSSSVAAEAPNSDERTNPDSARTRATTGYQNGNGESAPE